MATAPLFITPEQYLEEELKAELRHEYRDGQVCETAGGTLNHNRIARNLLIELHSAFRNSTCEVFINDVRATIPARRLFTYPDILIVASRPEVMPVSETILNAVAIIEVLSDSTRSYDRGAKFESYKTIPTLREYLTIEQYEPLVEHWVKDIDWMRQEFRRLEAEVQFVSVPAVIRLEAIYGGVNFD